MLLFYPSWKALFLSVWLFFQTITHIGFQFFSWLFCVLFYIDKGLISLIWLFFSSQVETLCNPCPTCSSRCTCIPRRPPSTGAAQTLYFNNFKERDLLLISFYSWIHCISKNCHHLAIVTFQRQNMEAISTKSCLCVLKYLPRLHSHFLATLVRCEWKSGQKEIRKTKTEKYVQDKIV